VVIVPYDSQPSLWPWYFDKKKTLVVRLGEQMERRSLQELRGQWGRKICVS